LRAVSLSLCGLYTFSAEFPAVWTNFFSAAPAFGAKVKSKILKARKWLKQRKLRSRLQQSLINVLVSSTSSLPHNLTWIDT
jgi:hypothetical protein